MSNMRRVWEAFQRHVGSIVTPLLCIFFGKLKSRDFISLRAENQRRSACQVVAEAVDCSDKMILNRHVNCCVGFENPLGDCLFHGTVWVKSNGKSCNGNRRMSNRIPDLTNNAIWNVAILFQILVNDCHESSMKMSSLNAHLLHHMLGYTKRSSTSRK